MTIRMARPGPEHPGRNILGVTVVQFHWQEAIDYLLTQIRNGSFTKVGFLNAHNANVASRDKDFALALRDFLILPDGVGVDVASRMLYGSTFPANLNGTDFIPALFEAAPGPLRIGLLGARRAIAEKAAAKLSALAPQHDYVVIHDGFFPPAEEPAILERIKQQRLDILLVALGVPRQEYWIARHITPGHCTMPIGVGALLDFLSGAVPRAPAWVRSLRLEWLYRLYLEPGRLWRRYILGNPAFLTRVLFQKLRGQS